MSKYSNEYDELIKKYSEKYNVDYTLIKSVIAQESSFDKSAYNKNSGCSGLMQLKPSTYKYVMNKSDVSDIFNPENNIEAGTKVLSDLLTKYQGDKEKALAGYFAGSSNVDKYGKEKYDYYYTSVLKIEDELINAGDVYSSGSSDTEPIENSSEISTWGNIFIIIFSILCVLGGVIFIVLSVKSNPSVKKSLKKSKKKVGA